MNTKKTISPVIATALLIVVAVASVVSFQTWFGSFSSDIFSDTETQSSNSVSDTQIEQLIGNSLYFRNGGTENITLNSIKINGVDCNISSTELTEGITELNVTICLGDIDNSNPKIVVYTTEKIYTKNIYIKDLTPYNVPENCLLNGTIVSHSSPYNFYNATLGTTCYSQARTCSDGTLNGSDTYTYSNCDQIYIIEYLIVAGGGGGGSGYAIAGGGGGGAGGYIITNSTLLSGTYEVIVGLGGNGSPSEDQRHNADNGLNSSFNENISIGGGGGGNYVNGSYSYNGFSGGSGGGGAGNAGGGTSTLGQGNNGGGGNGALWAGAGGGGAGGIGQYHWEAFGDKHAGNGGVGLSSNITGILTYYAGGGAGGGISGSFDYHGAGGNGGGGSTGQNATINSGGGGGGSAENISGGNGGTGIVIIRYLSNETIASGGTITNISNYIIHTFTSSGNFTLP